MHNDSTPGTRGKRKFRQTEDFPARGDQLEPKRNDLCFLFVKDKAKKGKAKKQRNKQRTKKDRRLFETKQDRRLFGSVFGFLSPRQSKTGAFSELFSIFFPGGAIFLSQTARSLRFTCDYINAA